MAIMDMFIGKVMENAFRMTGEALDKMLDGGELNETEIQMIREFAVGCRQVNLSDPFGVSAQALVPPGMPDDVGADPDVHGFEVDASDDVEADAVEGEEPVPEEEQG